MWDWQSRSGGSSLGSVDRNVQKKKHLNLIKKAGEIATKKLVRWASWFSTWSGHKLNHKTEKLMDRAGKWFISWTSLGIPFCRSKIQCRAFSPSALHFAWQKRMPAHLLLTTPITSLPSTATATSTAAVTFFRGSGPGLPSQRCPGTFAHVPVGGQWEGGERRARAGRFPYSHSQE